MATGRSGGVGVPDGGDDHPAASRPHCPAVRTGFDAQVTPESQQQAKAGSSARWPPHPMMQGCRGTRVVRAQMATRSPGASGRSPARTATIPPVRVRGKDRQRAPDCSCTWCRRRCHPRTAPPKSCSASRSFCTRCAACRAQYREQWHLHPDAMQGGMGDARPASASGDRASVQIRPRHAGPGFALGGTPNCVSACCA